MDLALVKEIQINCSMNEAPCLSVRQQQDKLYPHAALPADCNADLTDTRTASSEDFEEGAQLHGSGTSPSLLGQLVHIKAESLQGGRLELSLTAWISRSSELKWWASCHREPEMAPLQNEPYTAVSSHSRITLSHILLLPYCPMPPTPPELFIPCSTQDAHTSLGTGKTDKASDGCIMTAQLIGLPWLLGSCPRSHCSLASCTEAAVGLRRGRRSIDSCLLADGDGFPHLHVIAGWTDN